MQVLRHYLSIYRQFVATSFAQATSFRLHFILLILMDLAFYASTLLSVDIIYSHVSSFGPWKREQFLFFICFILVLDHLHMTFVSENFWEFGENVRTGTLDFVLLRPAAPLFTLLLRHMRPGSLMLMPVPWGLLGFYGSKIDLPLVSWVLLPVIVILAFSLLVSFETLLMMAIFWLVDSHGVNFIRIQFQNVSRWPDFVFLPGFRRLFSFVLPVLVIGSAPVKFLINPHDYYQIGLMLAYTAASATLCRLLWQVGLRRYESASS